MHSGVNTGLGVTADLNPDKGTHGITGDAINVAARLCDLAAPGEILIGLDTYSASKRHFTFEALKPREVKGKTEHISIYRLVSTKLSFWSILL